MNPSGDFDFRILSAVESPIAVLLKDATIRFANPQFTDLFGAADSMEGQYLEAFLEDSVALKKAIRISRSVSGGVPCRLAIKGQEGAIRFSITLLEKGDEEKYLLQSMSRRTDHFVNLNREFQNLHHALEKQNLISRRYLASNEGIQRFLQKLVHDIRAPLNSIVTAIDLAKEDVAENDYESLMSVLDTSEDSARRLLALADRLYEDLKARHERVNLEAVSLEPIINELRQDLDAAIKQTGARLEYKGEPFTLEADPLLLRQLLQNLIHNSIKFRSPKRPLVVEISVEQDVDGSAEIKVKDNGRGFESQLADSLFERFYRASGNDDDGLGLGLTTCRQIAELHRWKIFASGRPGEGATFTVLIR